MIPLSDSIHFVDAKGGNKFSLVSQGNIVRDKAVLELQAQSFEEFEDWKRCLQQVGIFPQSDDPSCSNTSNGTRNGGPLTTSGAIHEGASDADLERQIESLWILVDSYMRIVCKTLLDLVPKVIVKTLVKDSVSFMSRDMVTSISRIRDFESLMEENSSLLQRKQELEANVAVLSSALERLSEVELHPIDIPPPLYPPPKRLPQAPPKPKRAVPPPPTQTKSTNSQSERKESRSARADSGTKLTANTVLQPRGSGRDIQVLF